MSERPAEVAAARIEVERGRAAPRSMSTRRFRAAGTVRAPNLARDAWEAAKDKGADLAEDAVDAVAKRPVAATGVVAAIAMFLAREPLMDAAPSKLVDGEPKPSAKRESDKPVHQDQQAAQAKAAKQEETETTA